MGIVGLIITTIVASKPSLAIGLYWARKKYAVRMDIKSSMRILIGSSVAAAATLLVTNFIAYADWMELCVGILVFSTAYLIAAPILGAINKSDINNLKIMFSGLGIISKIINIPLNVMERLPNLT